MAFSAKSDRPSFFEYEAENGKVGIPAAYKNGLVTHAPMDWPKGHGKCSRLTYRDGKKRVEAELAIGNVDWRVQIVAKFNPITKELTIEEASSATD